MEGRGGEKDQGGQEEIEEGNRLILRQNQCPNQRGLVFVKPIAFKTFRRKNKTLFSGGKNADKIPFGRKRDPKKLV
jgi:hypothetical protein